MKSSAPTVGDVLANERSFFAIASDLVKARLTLLVLLTTLSGFYAGSESAMDGMLLFHTLFGTGLIACGAAALNEWWERDLDAKMGRTATRPIPSGEMTPVPVMHT